jgi:glycolate oxidase iron-sulfur subunit
VINASGCGTTIKDYGFMFRDEPAYAEKAKAVSALAKDITEVLENSNYAPTRETSA